MGPPRVTVPLTSPIRLTPSIKLWSDGFRAVALDTGCHRGLVVMWLSRSGWDMTSIAETIPETMD